jgi:CubicO group peptidase (beta-lactamase class C family)
MDEMLDFVRFRPVSNMRAYGLGVQLYPRSFSCGKEAIGHGGGNIGTSTYMVYLPEYHVSIVVMINAFPNRSLHYITKGLIRVVLRDLKAIGVIPYVDPLRLGFFAICISISATVIVVCRRRRQRRIRST